MTKSNRISKSEYFRDVNTSFEFAAWMIGRGDGWYGLASAFQLAGIEDGMNVRVSAGDQRKLFGRVIFGKQCVRINARTGVFQTMRSVSFGGDFDVTEHYPSHYHMVNGVWRRKEHCVW